MYAQTIPLSDTETLELTWHWRFRDFMVFYRGMPLGPPVDRKALKVGQTYALPDGRRLTVVLRKSGLEVWHGQVELIRGVRSGTVNYFFISADGLIFLGLAWIGMCFFLRLIFPEAEGDWAMLLVALPGLIPIALGLWARFTLSLEPLRIGFILLCLLIVQRLWDVVIIQGKIIPLDMIVLTVIALMLRSAIASAPPRKNKVRYVRRKGPLDGGYW